MQSRSKTKASQKKSDEGQRQEVLTKSLQLASQEGLEGLSIGSLATHLQMSRSGLFYYVKALGDFQIELIDFAADIFKREVVDPVIYIPNPVERIRKFLQAWPNWTEHSSPRLPGGCPLVAFLFELDGKEGPQRDRILYQLDRYDQFLKFLFQSCLESKDFSPKRKAEEFVRACWGFYLPLLWMRQRRLKVPNNSEITKQIDQLIEHFQIKEKNHERK